MSVLSKLHVGKPSQRISKKDSAITLRITNNSDSTIDFDCSLIPNSYLSGNVATKVSVKAKETKKVEVPFLFWSGKSDADLPPELRFKLTRGNESTEKTFVAPIGTFIGDLKNSVPKRIIHFKNEDGDILESDAPVNIAIIGPAGAGKTSFLHNVFTILAPDPFSSEIKRPFLVGSFQGHATTSYNRYELENGDYKMVHIWDTIGITANTAKGATMSLLLNGCLSDKGHSINDSIKDKDVKAKIKENIPLRGFRIPQAVIMMMTYEVVNDPEEEARMTKQVEDVRRLGYEPIIVVSKVDSNQQNGAQIRRNPLQLPSEMKENVDDLIKKLHVAPNNVFHMVSYVTEQDDRNFGIDLLTLRVIRSALRRAQEYIAVTEGGCGDYTSDNIFKPKPTPSDLPSMEKLVHNAKIVKPKPKIVKPPNPQLPEAVLVDVKQPQTAKSSTTSSTASEEECACCWKTKPAAVVLACDDVHVLCEEDKDVFKAGDQCPLCMSIIKKVICK